MTALATLPGWPEIGRAPGAPARRGGDGYPPYDVERFTEGSRSFLRITLAVAGFRPEDLDVTTAEGQLIVSGRQADEPERTYLHRGIAARRFRRIFALGAGTEVHRADLQNGLLAIDLIGPQPDASGSTTRGQR